MYFNRKMRYLGCFDSEHRAALAYDQGLRSLCRDERRLKKSLNFPSPAEVEFVESPQKARSRALAQFSHMAVNEEESFRRLHHYFQSSSYSWSYEIARVSGSARADAIFQPIGALSGGVQLQVKSTRSRGPSGCTYSFRGTNGYEGMVLVLIALDRDVLWAVPGKVVPQKTFNITLGSDRDQAWRTSDIGDTLKGHFQCVDDFPHVSVDQARLQCSTTNKVEERAHASMAKLFGHLGFRLKKSVLTGSTVDSCLEWGEHTWRVQEKASSLHTNGTYSVNIGRCAGALGRQPYMTTDFDLLLAAVLDEGSLAGIFVVPIAVLAERGVVGQRAVTLRFCPPWARAREATRLKYAWQLEHFVDLRAWTGKPLLPVEVRARLTELLKDAVKGRVRKALSQMSPADIDARCTVYAPHPNCPSPFRKAYTVPHPHQI